MPVQVTTANTHLHHTSTNQRRVWRLCCVQFNVVLSCFVKSVVTPKHIYLYLPSLCIPSVLAVSSFVSPAAGVCLWKHWNVVCQHRRQQLPPSLLILLSLKKKEKKEEEKEWYPLFIIILIILVLLLRRWWCVAMRILLMMIQFHNVVPILHILHSPRELIFHQVQDPHYLPHHSHLHLYLSEDICLLGECSRRGRHSISNSDCFLAPDKRLEGRVLWTRPLPRDDLLYVIECV